MEAFTQIDDLIIALSVLRARLQPCISYPRAEAISTGVRMAVTSPLYKEPLPTTATPVLLEGVAFLLREARECLGANIIDHG